MKLHEVVNQERTILSVMGEQDDPFNGAFLCSHNQLNALKGAPSYVGGDFWCQHNNLTSLEGAPTHVDGNFWCHNNRLTSLEGAPSNVGGDFLCHNNRLTSLEVAPSHIGKDFWCFQNELISLEGIHKHIKFIGGGFFAEQNVIKSHILGLLLIDGLNRVGLDDKNCEAIINKHLGKGKRGMFDAQQEMIEAGYPEMAKL